MAYHGTKAKGVNGEFGAAKKKAEKSHKGDGAAAIEEAFAEMAEEAAEIAAEAAKPAWEIFFEADWDAAAREDEMAWAAAGRGEPTWAA